MARITIDKSAVSKLMSDPKIRRWRENKSSSEVPVLYYYRRSYSTLKDDKIIEHGDGFTLSWIDPKEIRETGDIAFETVPVSDDLDITVGGERSIFSGDFNIGWSNAKFTPERRTSS